MRPCNRQGANFHSWPKCGRAGGRSPFGTSVGCRWCGWAAYDRHRSQSHSLRRPPQIKCRTVFGVQWRHLRAGAAGKAPARTAATHVEGHPRDFHARNQSASDDEVNIARAVAHERVTQPRAAPLAQREWRVDIEQRGIHEALTTGYCLVNPPAQIDLRRLRPPSER